MFDVIAFWVVKLHGLVTIVSEEHTVCLYPDDRDRISFEMLVTTYKTILSIPQIMLCRMISGCLLGTNELKVTKKTVFGV
jgi:hypothetical protein